MKLSTRLIAALAIAGLASFTACGGGGGGGGGSTSGGGGSPVVVPTPTQPPANPAACPTSGSVPTSVGVAAAGPMSIGRRAAISPPSASDQIPDMLVVTYSASVSSDAINTAALKMNASPRTDLDLGAIGKHAKTLLVEPGSASAVIARMKEVPGVLSVQHAQYRHMLAVPPNDPVYNRTGVPPYYQTASTRGQWDMHVMNFDGAWGQFAGTVAIGAPIAVIDTGVDVTQLELTGGKITRTRCFVTFPSGTAQTTGTFVTDTDGHGTNVAGIADDDTNNGLEFAGGGWSAPLMAYRVFPSDISGGCSGSSDPQCSSTDVDIVAAINDAVANGAKVINLSLGSTPPCNDPLEMQAVANAISHNVVVVAAAGNEGLSQLDCPASYPGVIAVGASALNDSNPLVIREYVASYSNYLTTNGNGLYMVAPGGDPGPGTDNDLLHWINNLYSSTGAPLGGVPPSCGNDCGRALFAGTSQATPHVVGVVSLMLAVGSHSQTPAMIASDLCTTADPIPGETKAGCGRVNAAAAVAKAATQ